MEEAGRDGQRSKCPVKPTGKKKKIISTNVSKSPTRHVLALVTRRSLEFYELIWMGRLTLEIGPLVWHWVIELKWSRPNSREKGQSNYKVSSERIRNIVPKGCVPKVILPHPRSRPHHFDFGFVNVITRRKKKYPSLEGTALAKLYKICKIKSISVSFIFT